MCVSQLKNGRVWQSNLAKAHKSVGQRAPHYSSVTSNVEPTIKAGTELNKLRSLPQ